MELMMLSALKEEKQTKSIMKYFTLLITIVLTSYTLGQDCQDCFEDKNISTNPVEPENCEMDIYANGKNNQFLNSFDWGRNNGSIFQSLSLNQIKTTES